MNETRIRFEYELLEDLHAGTGSGRLGMIDDVQARDARGWPVVWMSSFRGVLREAGRDFLASLGQGNAILEELLGKGGDSDGKALVRSLRLAGEPDRPCLIWASTAREAGSRRPDDHTLRFIELAPAGLRLQGEIRVHGASGEERTFLMDCLRRITALGGRRTRGWGAVRLRLLEGEEQRPNARPEKGQGGSRRLRLVLRNLEPLALARTAYAGNLIPSRSFLPGSTLRGALLHWLSRAGQVPLADALSRTMSVGNGYPLGDVSADEALRAEVLPTPASLREPKGGGSGSALWWAAPEAASRTLFAHGETDALATPPTRDGPQTKRIKTEDYLVRVPGGPWRRIRPRMGVLLHNEVPVSRRDGTPQGQDDSFFSEQVLWEGQLFACDLRFGSTEEAARFAEAASGLFAGSWLPVGRGGRPAEVVKSAWQESTLPGPAPSGRLTITLTSDLIARTPWLNFHTRLTPEAVGLPAGLKVDAEHSEGTEVHGFNSASGLPRVPALAVRRGAVLRISGERSEIDEARRRLAECDALGERTEEGFGRFVLDLDVHEPRASPAVDPAPAVEWRPNPREGVLARVRAFLEAHKGALRGPSASQWQALRVKSELEDVLPLLERLIQNAGRQSGKAWKDVAAPLRDAVAKEQPEQQRFFIDRLARRVVAGLRAQEGGE